MMDEMQMIDVIIPAYNEEKSIGKVIADIPKDWVRNIVVCNNASTDRTAIVAAEAGAKVINTTIRGYGTACLSGIDWLSQQTVLPSIVVFIDGDYSDYPEKLPDLVAPIIKDDCDLVIGSRALGNLQQGSMTVPQIFGNWLATNLIRLIYGYHFTDLGPFRAVKWHRLMESNMEDKDFGWTVELQVKAAKLKWKTTEIAVDYKKRIGKSKVSGTIKGTLLAGHKILWTIFKLI
ncbi:MAG: glycosyltransferase family 2 protein [Saprospiraceae bacterium]|nr:glycosyltransferase family 2 protein [Saprospiraceae bacterium]